MINGARSKISKIQDHEFNHLDKESDLIGHLMLSISLEGTS